MAARWIPRAFDMYCNLNEVIKICLLLEDEASDSDDDNAEDEKRKRHVGGSFKSGPEAIKRHQRVFEYLKEYAPYLMSLLRKKSEREKFNSLLNDPHSRGRRKSSQASTLPPQPDKKVIDPPINQTWVQPPGAHQTPVPGEATPNFVGGSSGHQEDSERIHSSNVSQMTSFPLFWQYPRARLQSRTDRGGFSLGILGRAGSQAHFHIAILRARGDYDSNDHEDDLVLMKQQVAARRARLASSPDHPAQAIVGSPLCHPPSSPAAPLTPLPPSSPLVQPRRFPPPHSPPPRNVPKGKREQMEDVPDHWDTGSPLSEAPNGDTENDIQQPQPKPVEEVDSVHYFLCTVHPIATFSQS
ncbi:hypothetical protein BU15DRAFT_79103 [Melanogaster broomeanus]|nr:hypothetical protein BU15DRAFT_79103 [Melanogaster broomeanus]